LRSFRDESQVEYEQARATLYEAQTKLFNPFLTSTPQGRLPFEFERLAYAYVQYRIQLNMLLLKAFGLRQFEQRYLSAFMSITKEFVREAVVWDLDASAVENALRKYLASVIRLVSVAQLGSAVQTGRLSELLSSATKADFGLTAMFLAMEKSIATEKWVVRETFQLTQVALAQYDELVSELWERVAKQSSISGSLRIEGDVEEALHELNANTGSFVNQKPQ
jgi:hypothetical protein